MEIYDLCASAVIDKYNHTKVTSSIFIDQYQKKFSSQKKKTLNRGKMEATLGRAAEEESLSQDRHSETQAILKHQNSAVESISTM